MEIENKRSKLIAWVLQNAKLTSSFFFVVVFAIVIIIIRQRYQIVQESKRIYINSILENVKQRFEQLNKTNQNVALTMALTIGSDGKPKDFEEIAERVIKSNPYLQAIQLVPDGVIKYVYPLKGNEKALNHDLFKDEGANLIEAKKSESLKQLYYQGPVKLMQGKIGVVGRLPIFVKNKFWGFSAIVITLDSLSSMTGLNVKAKNYQFQLAKNNPITGKEEFFLPYNEEFKFKHSTSIVIPEGDWRVYAIDEDASDDLINILPVLLLGVSMTLICSIFLYKFLRKQAEITTILDKRTYELLLAENKYKTIFDHAGVGIGRVNSITGEFLEVNAQFCNLLGYSATELQKTKIKRLIHHEDLREDRMQFRSMMTGQIKNYMAERRYVCKDGQVKWAQVFVTLLWGESEALNNHIIIVEDITSRKDYEQELIASKQHIANLINSIDGIVWEKEIHEDGYESSFISNKVYDILGYTPQEWLADPDFHTKHLHEEDRVTLFSYIDDFLLKQQNHEKEYRMIAKDGSVVWVKDIVSVTPSVHSPEKLRGIMIDITAQKEAQDSLAKSYALVREQNERLLNFSHIVSHNLRSHAGNIHGIVALIESAQTDHEKTELLQLLKKVVDTLNETLSNLSNIVNINTRFDILKEPLNLKQYTEAATTTLNAQIISQQAVINNRVAGNVEVIFNKSYLESVLLNLLSNALRYTHPNRKPVINIETRTENDCVVLVIADNGLGIDMQKNKGKIFGLYQTFNGNNDARGLGLFITRNQIEAMGGKIEVESTLNKGTTFKIIFAPDKVE